MVKSKEETNYDNVHWADFSANRVLQDCPNHEVYIVASGVTPSGIVHVGHLREILTTELVRRALEKKGVKTKFIYSWDSYDAFRKVPKNIPQEWEEYLRLPNASVPDPWKCHESFAEHWMKLAEDAISVFKFPIEFQRQHKIQTSGIYADEIKFALNNRKKIKTILDKYRKEPLPANWFPLTVYCEKCHKDTTITSNYDEKYSLDYTCKCGHKNRINFKNTPIVKLPWRIDWAMRWKYYNVTFEPSGKDHASTGGSWTTGKEIIKQIWGINGPVGAFYTNIGMKGQGGKVSSSSGNGATVANLLEVYTPELVIFLFAGTRPNAEFSISFDIDVIKIYEDFDRLERIYYGIDEEKNPKKLATYKRIYELSLVGRLTPQKKMPYQPSFRMLTTVAQANDFDYEKVKTYYAEELKTQFDKNRLKERFECVKNWLEKYAPEDMKFSINNKIEIKLDKKQQSVVKEVVLYLDDINDPKELFGKFREIAQKNNLEIKDFFSLMYRIILNKEKGPKLAEFMLENKKKVLALLKQI